jgi:hypothetical protein
MIDLMKSNNAWKWCGVSFPSDGNGKEMDRAVSTSSTSPTFSLRQMVLGDTQLKMLTKLTKFNESTHDRPE